jgi:F-type H+-transporting ATPase subunit b
MKIDVPLLLWTLISFAVFSFLLDRILFRPLLRVMEERRRKVSEGIAAGREAEALLQSKQEEGEMALEACRETYARRENEIRAAAASDLNKRLAEARGQEEKRYLEGLAQLRERKEHCEKTLEEKVPELAVLAADMLTGGAD